MGAVRTSPFSTSLSSDVYGSLPPFLSLSFLSSLLCLDLATFSSVSVRWVAAVKNLVVWLLLLAPEIPIRNVVWNQRRCRRVDYINSLSPSFSFSHSRSVCLTASLLTSVKRHPHLRHLRPNECSRKFSHSGLRFLNRGDQWPVGVVQGPPWQPITAKSHQQIFSERKTKPETGNPDFEKGTVPDVISVCRRHSHRS